MEEIGQSPARPDGLPKVSGAARYGDDFSVVGMWFGATVRSPHPRAEIEGIAWRPEDAPEGAVCVTAADLPGPNGVQLIDDSWPILAGGETRHVGEPVALVAAPDRLGARRARRGVAVRYRPLPAVLDLEAAAADEPLSSLELGCGDVEAALAAAEHVVEGTYRTGYQEHIYIECQVMTAWFERNGRLVVMGSMQCPYYVHRSLMHAFGLPSEMVRVRAAAVGGGFGGKEDYPSMIAIHAALLARASGHPVRLAYDRHEDIVGTTKRHPAVVRERTGVDDEGRLLAMDIDVVLDGGAYRTLSPVVLSRALLHAAGPYRCQNVRVRGRALRTHTATNGAFRGFGAPQTQFATERQMDRVARRVGLDPLEIRRRNALRPGDTLPTGQVIEQSAALACLEKAAELTGFAERWRANESERSGRGTRREGDARRGIGLALYYHGAGFTGSGEHKMRSPVTVRLDEAGRLEVLTAMTDMGQGCAVVFPQIARQAGGLLARDVRFPEPDTSVVPDSGPTVASRTTMIVGATIARAVEELERRLLEWWREHRGLEGEARVAESRVSVGEEEWPFREVARAWLEERGPLEVTIHHEPPAWQTFDEETYRGAAYPAFSWGCDVVEVEVDPDTLEVRPLRATAVCEVGKAIHPVLCAGQIEGGTLQALGWALLEEVKLENGRYLNDRLATYIIPTFKDSPPIDVHLLEEPGEVGPFGAKGVGELPMDGGAPAAAAAIENATALPVTDIPATPERLLAWSEAVRTGSEFAAGAGSASSPGSVESGRAAGGGGSSGSSGSDTAAGSEGA